MPNIGECLVSIVGPRPTYIWTPHGKQGVVICNFAIADHDMMRQCAANGFMKPAADRVLGASLSQRVVSAALTLLARA